MLAEVADGEVLLAGIAEPARHGPRFTAHPPLLVIAEQHGRDGPDRDEHRKHQQGTQIDTPYNLSLLITLFGHLRSLQVRGPVKWRPAKQPVSKSRTWSDLRCPKSVRSEEHTSELQSHL